MNIIINTKTKKMSFVSPDVQGDLKTRLAGFAGDLENDTFGLRIYRDGLLNGSDWVVTKANETGVGISTEWKTYRQSLRDLPAHERAPNKFMIADWPLFPDETEVPDGAKHFIAELRDPVGLGTTSWVGITTTGEYYDQTPEPEPIPEEEPEPEEETPPASPE